MNNKLLVGVLVLLIIGAYCWRFAGRGHGSREVEPYSGNVDQTRERIDRLVGESEADIPTQFLSSHPIDDSSALPLEVDTAVHSEWISIRDRAEVKGQVRRRSALPVLLGTPTKAKARMLPDIIALSTDLNPTLTPLTSEQLAELRLLVDTCAPKVQAACYAVEATRSEAMVKLNDEGRLLDRIEDDVEFRQRLENLKQVDERKHRIASSGRASEAERANMLGYQSIVLGGEAGVIHRYYPLDRLEAMKPVVAARNVYQMQYIAAVVYWSHSVGLIDAGQRDSLLDKASKKLVSP